MGWTVHNRLGWKPDHCPTMGSHWRCKKHYTSKSLASPILYLLEKELKPSKEIVDQALPCPCLLFDCHPGHFLRGTIRNPFLMPGQSRRRRRLHVIRVPGYFELQSNAGRACGRDHGQPS